MIFCQGVNGEVIRFAGKTKFLGHRLGESDSGGVTFLPDDDEIGSQPAERLPEVFLADLVSCVERGFSLWRINRLDHARIGKQSADA
jgi:hypothetical protein